MSKSAFTKPNTQNRDRVLASHLCEVEVAEGLESIARDELAKFVSTEITVGKGALRFHYSGNLVRLLQLKTVVSIYLMLHFDVPRPRALLGHEHFQQIIAAVHIVLDLDKTAYHTLYLSAAGDDSSVMQRIKSDLSLHTGLAISDAGDLLIRVRRAANGWDVLIRMSPRPLATRDWRVCNFEGALNGPTAQAMVRLLDPKTDDTFLNIACGSGTLLIERLDYSPARMAIGIDYATQALDCAQSNINAANYSDQIQIFLGDVGRLPFKEKTFNSIAADLPFGQLTGSHDENLLLYPALLKEAARVAHSETRFVLITHEIRLIENLLTQSSIGWRLEKTLRTELRGLHPRIYVLRRI